MNQTEWTLDGQPVDLAEFLSDNRETFDIETCHIIGALRPGESLIVGGGAGAEFVLRREAVPCEWCAGRARLSNDHSCPRCEGTGVRP
jgi:hypothetical protein